MILQLLSWVTLFMKVKEILEEDKWEEVLVMDYYSGIKEPNLEIH